ncbi:unnamed protein product [Nezara viridula]|uniref:Uncharacterized protein n=1 Tax=Nezara viridula TaxID=85310 RepID=A0A9P0H415_NEZVI|nr:unnamed protein product [Nezara viridula]
MRAPCSVQFMPPWRRRRRSPKYSTTAFESKKQSTKLVKATSGVSFTGPDWTGSMLFRQRQRRGGVDTKLSCSQIPAWSKSGASSMMTAARLATLTTPPLLSSLPSSLFPSFPPCFIVSPPPPICISSAVHSLPPSSWVIVPYQLVLLFRTCVAFSRVDIATNCAWILIIK